MPELPEVETITTDLRKAVIGRKISAVRSLDEKTLRLAGGVSGAEAMIGLLITRARRQAKYVLIGLSPEAEREPTLTLALHLAVYGQCYPSRVRAGHWRLTGPGHQAFGAGPAGLQSPVRF